MRDDGLAIPLLSSLAIHITVILAGSAIFNRNQLQRQEFLPVGLVDLPRVETPPPPKKFETSPEAKKLSPLPSPKVEKRRETKPVIKKESPRATKAESAKPEPPLPSAVGPKEEPDQTLESQPAPPVQTEPLESFPSPLRNTGGGSEAGAGSLFGKGDAGIIPGAGTTGGGGETLTGLGRGSGPPGLPAQTAPIKTNRHAKPVQTVRAFYPPMALRAGIESDVTLKILVDTEGNVSQAEIVKSGGGGFDEEALKAVSQARFEPAVEDGKSVAAEFTYVYRFRLKK